MQRLLKRIKGPFTTLTKGKKKEELLGEGESENQLKTAAGLKTGLKKDFATVFNKDNNGGLGDGTGWQVLIN